MFRLENISKQYTRRGKSVDALRSTDLAFGGGEFVAVVGASGSGKTTLLSILGGMLAPSTGQVWLDGQALYETSVAERARLRQRKIGFIFQTFNLVPYLSALENVQLPLMFSDLAPVEQRERSEQLLRRVGLGERLDHKPCELSTGQQQRVAVARTLANDPVVILADEPTGNLDPATREQILGFLEEFSREGRTVVVVTHDPVVASRAGRTITLEEGVVRDSSSALMLKSA